MKRSFIVISLTLYSVACAMAGIAGGTVIDSNTQVSIGTMLTLCGTVSAIVVPLTVWLTKELRAIKDAQVMMTMRLTTIEDSLNSRKCMIASRETKHSHKFNCDKD